MGRIYVPCFISYGRMRKAESGTESCGQAEEEQYHGQ